MIVLDRIPYRRLARAHAHTIILRTRYTEHVQRRTNPRVHNGGTTKQDWGTTLGVSGNEGQRPAATSRVEKHGSWVLVNSNMF